VRPKSSFTPPSESKCSRPGLPTEIFKLAWAAAGWSTRESRNKTVTIRRWGIRFDEFIATTDCADQKDILQAPAISSTLRPHMLSCLRPSVRLSQTLTKFSADGFAREICWCIGPLAASYIGWAKH